MSTESSPSSVPAPLGAAAGAESAATAAAAASLHFACPRCERGYILPAPAGGGVKPAFLTCDRCAFAVKFLRPVPDPARSIEQCALCGCRDFYLQKDFNRKLGLSLVVISAIVALIVMILTVHWIGLAVLLGVTLIDWVAFRLVRDVTVCYLCHAIYRGFPRNSGHEGFYLGNEERFKRLRQVWMERMEAEG